METRTKVVHKNVSKFVISLEGLNVKNPETSP